MSPAEQAILATDDARIAAAKNSDAAALDSIYSDDFQIRLLDFEFFLGRNGHIGGFHSGIKRERFS